MNRNYMNATNVPVFLVDLKCSCSACDSMACFTKRQKDEFCTCNECTKYKRCIDSIDKSYSTLVSFDDKEFEEEFAREPMEEEEFEFDKYNTIITEKQSTAYFNLTNKSLKQKPEDAADNNKNNNNISTVFPNLTVTSCRNKASTAQISAQVMNVPYIDFENSIALSKPEPLSNFPKMSFYDLYQKIKEVYKACSCKVCECVAGKSRKNEFCRCRPCECNDCKSNDLKKNVELSEAKTFARVRSHCFRESLRENLNELKKECSCLPCECIQCVDSMAEPCACKSCQCIECKSLMLNHRTLVVAAVGDDTQTRQTCQCSPCECVECITANYGTSSNLVRHDMSTGLTRHPYCHCETCNNEACIPDGNNTCRCERHDKVMRKPVPRDSHDYDIRTAMIFQKRPVNKHDTNEMLAFITNKHPKFGTYNKECSCGLCECLYCTFKENSVDAVKSSNIWLPNNSKIYDDLNYDFRPYDHKKNYNINKTIANNHLICNCAEYDSLIGHKSDKHFKSYCKKRALTELSSKDKCSPCECTYCKCKNCDGEVIYPIKKGEKLTPAIFKNRLKGSFFRLDKEKHQENYTEIFLTSSHSMMGRNEQTEDDRTIKSRYCDFKIISKINEHLYNEKLNPRERAKQDELVNSLNEIDSFNIIPEKDVTQLQVSRSNISLSSSTSNFKDSESNSIQSGNKNKCRASPCNSSDHENSNYVVQFPKINTNIMQSSKERGSKHEALNMPPLRKNKQIKVSSTFYNLGEENNSKHVSSRPNTENLKRPDKLSNDECSFVQNEKFWLTQISVSNQCNIIPGANFKKTLITAQTEIQDEIWFKNNGINHRHFIDYTKRLGEFHRNTIKETVFRKAQKSAYISKTDFTDNEHYERIQKILKDARSFSQQLKNMLEEYEKANRDFKSITKDLICPIVTHIENVPNNTELCSSTSLSEIGFSNITKKLNIIPIKYENTNSTHTDKDTQETGDNAKTNFIESIDVLKSKEYNVQNNNMSFKQNICDAKESNVDKEIMKIALRNVHPSSSFPGLSDTSTTDDILYCENEMNPILEENETLSDGTVSPTECEVKKKNIKAFNTRSNKTLNKHTKIFNKLDDTEIMKISNVNDQPIINENSMINVAATNLSCAAYNNAAREINNLVHKSTFEEHSVDNKAIDIYTISPIETELLQSDGQAKPWPILKKNFHVAECRDFCRHNKELRKDLEKTKEFERSISWQSETALTQEGLVVRQENESLSNSCDAMKVNFLTVRKVSTHTVMVRWNAPRTLKNVQGYELSVDGKPVQMMLNTSRCMAVVTCLPHSDRIILTVRTVMLSPCPNGHRPATSIVYKPRSKM